MYEFKIFSNGKVVEHDVLLLNKEEVEKEVRKLMIEYLVNDEKVNYKIKKLGGDENGESKVN